MNLIVVKNTVEQFFKMTWDLIGIWFLRVIVPLIFFCLYWKPKSKVSEEKNSDSSANASQRARNGTNRSGHAENDNEMLNKIHNGGKVESHSQNATSTIPRIKFTDLKNNETKNCDSSERDTMQDSKNGDINTPLLRGNSDSKTSSHKCKGNIDGPITFAAETGDIKSLPTARNPISGRLTQGLGNGPLNGHPAGTTLSNGRIPLLARKGVIPFPHGTSVGKGAATHASTKGIPYGLHSGEKGASTGNMGYPSACGGATNASLSATGMTGSTLSEDSVGGLANAEMSNTASNLGASTATNPRSAITGETGGTEAHTGSHMVGSASMSSSSANQNSSNGNSNPSTANSDRAQSSSPAHDTPVRKQIADLRSKSTPKGREIVKEGPTVVSCEIANLDAQAALKVISPANLSGIEAIYRDLCEKQVQIAPPTYKLLVEVSLNAARWADQQAVEITQPSHCSPRPSKSLPVTPEKNTISDLLALVGAPRQGSPRTPEKEKLYPDRKGYLRKCLTTASGHGINMDDASWSHHYPYSYPATAAAYYYYPPTAGDLGWYYPTYIDYPPELPVTELPVISGGITSRPTTSNTPYYHLEHEGAAHHGAGGEAHLHGTAGATHHSAHRPATSHHGAHGPTTSTHHASESAGHHTNSSMGHRHLSSGMHHHSGISENHHHTVPVGSQHHQHAGAGTHHGSAAGSHYSHSIGTSHHNHSSGMTSHHNHSAGMHHGDTTGTLVPHSCIPPELPPTIPPELPQTPVCRPYPGQSNGTPKTQTPTTYSREEMSPGDSYSRGIASRFPSDSREMRSPGETTSPADRSRDMEGEPGDLRKVRKEPVKREERRRKQYKDNSIVREKVDYSDMNAWLTADTDVNRPTDPDLNRSVETDIIRDSANSETDSQIDSNRTDSQPDICHKYSQSDIHNIVRKSCDEESENSEAHKDSGPCTDEAKGLSTDGAAKLDSNDVGTESRTMKNVEALKESLKGEKSEAGRPWLGEKDGWSSLNTTYDGQTELNSSYETGSPDRVTLRVGTRSKDLTPGASSSKLTPSLPAESEVRTAGKPTPVTVDATTTGEIRKKSHEYLRAPPGLSFKFQ